MVADEFLADLLETEVVDVVGLDDHLVQDLEGLEVVQVVLVFEEVFEVLGGLGFDPLQ